MKAIKACLVNDPRADEIRRYAGNSQTFTATIDGYILLVKPSNGLVRPWIRQNMERLASFGIKGEIINLNFKAICEENEE